MFHEAGASKSKKRGHIHPENFELTRCKKCNSSFGQSYWGLGGVPATGKLFIEVSGETEW